MRTTISLPDDLHAQLVSISRDRRETVSRTVEDLVRRGLGVDRPSYRKYRDPDTGFIVLDFGGTIAEAHVRSLDDDE